VSTNRLVVVATPKPEAEVTVVVLVYVIELAAVAEFRNTAAVEAPTAPSIDKPFVPPVSMPMYTLLCPVSTIPEQDNVGSDAPVG
jgi:hypothetical protein